MVCVHAAADIPPYTEILVHYGSQYVRDYTPGIAASLHKYDIQEVQWPSAVAERRRMLVPKMSVFT